MSKANKTGKQSSKPVASNTSTAQEAGQTQENERTSYPKPANPIFDSDIDTSSTVESAAVVTSSGYDANDERSESNSARPLDIKFDRTVSVPVDAESVRQSMQVCHEDDSGQMAGQTPRGMAMKKRSQSACKT
ncbi:hypothetical protein ElyMa_006244300 [Elysia marginata]|uniref:Uncharacterized protein n=1 Tax=Elysia marginata TaxID=1093978 RepID=A0AAV4H7I3_9GAST|nr:hypothetical protein ElyMa_006244300 [Elysia marginata]